MPRVSTTLSATAVLIAISVTGCGEHSNLTRDDPLQLASVFEGFNEGRRGIPPCS